MGYSVEKSKLTLWMDKEMINFGKRFAKEHDKSLSELFQDYLQGIKKINKAKIEITPGVKRMMKLAKPREVDEEAYHKHLEEKYLNG